MERQVGKEIEGLAPQYNLTITCVKEAASIEVQGEA